jgi:hypothetical protein
VAHFVPVVGISNTTPGTLDLAWPGSATGWVLQESPDLMSPNWVASTLPVTVEGGQNHASITSPANSRFFRLMSP